VPLTQAGTRPKRSLSFSLEERPCTEGRQKVSRADHIAGLEVGRLTPVDIEYFFRTLPPRVPNRVSEDHQVLLNQLHLRLHNLAVYLGDPLAVSFDHNDVSKVVSSIGERLERMKRREWRARIAGIKVLQHLRLEIGEISADLNQMSTG